MSSIRSTKNTRSPQALKLKPKAEQHAIEVIARGVLIRGSRVLMCRDLKHGYLYLPGGHVDFGESAAQALRREFVEEANLPVSVGQLVLVSEGVFETKRRHHEINLVFHVEHTGAAKLDRVTSQESHLGMEWLEFAAIQESDVRPEAAKAYLASIGREAGGTAEWVSEISPHA